MLYFYSISEHAVCGICIILLVSSMLMKHFSKTPKVRAYLPQTNLARVDIALTHTRIAMPWSSKKASTDEKS